MARSCQWGKGMGEKTQKSIFSNNLKTVNLKIFPNLRRNKNLKKKVWPVYRIMEVFILEFDSFY